MEKIFVISLSTLLFFMTTCSDDGTLYDDSPNDLLGSWNNIDDQLQGIITTTYTFNADFSYVYKVDFYGFNGEPKTKLTDSSKDSGGFEVEGDSLFLSRPASEGVFKSKFWLENDVLHLRYISYPADAPVITQMEYNRVD